MHFTLVKAILNNVSFYNNDICCSRIFGAHAHLFQVETYLNIHCMIVFPLRTAPMVTGWDICVLVETSLTK